MDRKRLDLFHKVNLSGGRGALLTKKDLSSCGYHEPKQLDGARWKKRGGGAIKSLNPLEDFAVEINCILGCSSAEFM